MPTDPHADARRAFASATMEPMFEAMRDVRPEVRHHSTARWEMSRDWYVRLRTLAWIGQHDDDPDPEEIAKWQISPGDTCLSLPITEGQGEPRIVADVPASVWLPAMDGPVWAHMLASYRETS